MDKKILLIKSSSLQHIQFVIDGITGYFQVESVDILMHKHVENKLEERLPVKETYLFPLKNDFSISGIMDSRLNGLRSQGYDAVIIPCLNVSSTGYENVIAMTLCLKYKELYICNINGQILKINKKAIFWRLSAYYLSYLPASIFTVLISFITLFIFCIYKGITKIKGHTCETE